MSTSISNGLSVKIWGLLILLSILWGSSFFFVGVAVDAIQPLTIVTLRVGIAAIVLWGVAALLGARPPKDLRIWRTFLSWGCSIMQSLLL